jgi:DNA-binding MarR family transcriptional regulator
MTSKLRSPPSDEPIILNIHRLSRSILRSSTAQYMHQFGIGVPQAQILNAIGSCGTLSSKAIAEFTAMNKALVSRSLSELTRLGYTTLSTEASDARRSLWQLTPRGVTFVAAFRPMRVARRARLLQALTPDERALLTRLIEKLIATSEEMGRQEAAERRTQRSGSGRSPRGNGRTPAPDPASERAAK